MSAALSLVSPLAPFAAPAVYSADANLVLRAVGGCAPSMSRDVTRPHLSSLAVSVVAGVLRVESTDGHRLTRWEHGKVGEADDTAGPVLVPADDVKALLAALKAACKAPVPLDVEITIPADPAVQATIVVRQHGGGMHVATCRLPGDVQYPPTDHAVPRENRNGKAVAEIGIDLRLLADAHDAFKAAACGKVAMVGAKFCFDGDLGNIALRSSAVPEMVIIVMPYKM
jgi:hypothetical protein